MYCAYHLQVGWWSSRGCRDYTKIKHVVGCGNREYVIKILFLFYFLIIWNEYYTKIMNIIDNTLVPFHSIPFHSIPFHSIPFHSITLHYITLHYIYIAPVPRDSQARYLKYTLCFIEIYTASNVMTCLTLVNIRVDKQFENDYLLLYNICLAMPHRITEKISSLTLTVRGSMSVDVIF